MLQISELRTVYARPGNYHHIPSRRQRPAVNDLANTPLGAVAINGAPYLLAHHQPKLTLVQPVRKHPHYNDTAEIRPTPAKHSGKLLACGKRPQSSH